MTAVIGCDDETVFVRKRRGDLFNIIPARFDALHIFLAHPSVAMSCEIGVSEIEEGKVNGACLQEADRLIREIFVRLEIGEFRAAHEAGIGEDTRTHEIPQFVPAVKERACFAELLQRFAKSRNRSYLRHIGIGRRTVSCGIDAVKERKVARERDGRHDGGCRHSAFSARDDFLCRFDIRQRIGTHAVRQDQDRLHKISSVYDDFTFGYCVRRLSHLTDVFDYIIAKNIPFVKRFSFFFRTLIDKKGKNLYTDNVESDTYHKKERTIRMKRFTTLIALILAILTLLCSCNAKPPEDTKDSTSSQTDDSTSTSSTESASTGGANGNETTTKKSLKVLAIGNSFSVDAMEYLWDICDSAGYDDVVLGNLYIGGCSLDTHWSNMQSGAAAYEYYVNDLGSWRKTKKSVLYALESEEWDIITIQQVSQDSGRPETFKNLQNILNYINQHKKNPDAKIYWHMTWAYQTGSTHSGFSNYNRDQMKMYKAITSAAQGILQSYGDIDGLIPSGTAIQNLRTSYLGDKLTRDGYHLNYSAGRYTAALTWFHTFTGQSLEDATWYPKGTNAVNPADLPAIREAVTNAVAEPFAVTNSTHAPKVEPIKTSALTEADKQILTAAGFKPEEYAVLDLEFTVQGYYNSSESSILATAQTTTASNVVNFNGSRIFERAAIPYGSVISVSDGYQYRPEAWTDLNAKTSPRPANVTQSLTVVDEEWWGNYTHRAFNLSAVTTRAMTAADCEKLRVYVPTVEDPTIPESQRKPETELLPSGDQMKADFEVLEKLGLLYADKMSGYALFDWKPQVASYYNSSSNSNRISSANSNASNIPNFTSSDIFTKADIPVGTIIIVDKGYQYRPEGWSDLNAKTSPRPENVSTNVIVVDESWWAKYEYRAFNLSALATKTMTQADSAHLRIYVPVL